MANEQTRTEPLDLDAAWEALIADLRALNVDPRSTRYVTETHRPLIEAAIRSAEAREAARLRTALDEIADASRQRSECPTPGNCMYPQHHSDDESGSEHADRLRRMARAALVKP